MIRATQKHGPRFREPLPYNLGCFFVSFLRYPIPLPLVGRASARRTRLGRKRRAGLPQKGDEKRMRWVLTRADERRNCVSHSHPIWLLLLSFHFFWYSGLPFIKSGVRERPQKQKSARTLALRPFAPSRGQLASPVPHPNLARRNRNAFAITDTELKLIAAAASMGLSNRPNAG